MACVEIDSESVEVGVKLMSSSGFAKLSAIAFVALILGVRQQGPQPMSRTRVPIGDMDRATVNIVM